MIEEAKVVSEIISPDSYEYPLLMAYHHNGDCCVILSLGVTDDNKYYKGILLKKNHNVTKEEIHGFKESSIGDYSERFTKDYIPYEGSIVLKNK